MNSQGFTHQYPPPTQQPYPFQFPYPAPPQGVVSQQQPVPPYQYHPQPPPQQQQLPQQQAPYFRSLQNTPQTQTPAPSRQRKGRQNARNTSNASAPGGPGAPPAEPTSPEMDDFDASLMNALRDDQTQQQEQSNGNHQSPDGEGEDNEPIYNLPPPPENTYPNEAELEKAMHAWSLEHGYEMVRRASKKNAAGKMYKRYYHCSKHGIKNSKLSPSERRRASRKSNRMGCPMSLASVAVDPTNPDAEWQIRHRKTHHNHPANEGVSLAGHRRRARTEGVEKAVDGLFSIGTSTAQVLQFLQRTQEKGLFTRTDVANMKLKWKKFGTCAYKGSLDDDHPGEGGIATSGRTISGKTACVSCRQKKVGCGSERPICRQCRSSGRECRYDQDEQEQNAGQAQEGAASSSQLNRSTPTPVPTQARQQPQQPAEPPPSSTGFLRGNRPGRLNAFQAAATKEILDELRSFQAEHIKPERLSLQSSSVEILAQSSCGMGESYKSLPMLNHPNEWPGWRDAMIEVSMRENTYDVLTGSKSEPQKPPPVPGASEADEVDTWNEYIKQLAIYNRRNGLLLSALWTHLSPNLRSRVNTYRSASAIWSALEDLCAPRGSETAFKLFLELHSITYDSSADLKDYIHRLTSTYESFKKLKLNTSPPILNAPPRTLSSVRAGGEAVTEEMICMLFLRNLGPEWRRWVEGLVATNNIGGFGTGERLGLRELGKRAEAYRAMQERAL